MKDHQKRSEINLPTESFASYITLLSTKSAVTFLMQVCPETTSISTMAITVKISNNYNADFATDFGENFPCLLNPKVNKLQQHHRL